MRLTDEKGRLFGRVSVIDIVILLAVAGLGFGYVYKQTSGEVRQIVNADTTVYVTFQCEQLRAFSVAALDEGDVFFQRHDRKSLGPVTRITLTPTEGLLYKPDGTVVLAPMEGRQTAYVTLRCEGSVTDAGYFIKGSQQFAPGQEFAIHSNRLLLNARVYRVDTTAP